MSAEEKTLNLNMRQKQLAVLYKEMREVLSINKEYACNILGIDISLLEQRESGDIEIPKEAFMSLAFLCEFKAIRIFGKNTYEDAKNTEVRASRCHILNRILFKDVPIAVQ